jgi:hypothetical protein
MRLLENGCKKKGIHGLVRKLASILLNTVANFHAAHFMKVKILAPAKQMLPQIGFKALRDNATEVGP